MLIVARPWINASKQAGVLDCGQRLPVAVPQHGGPTDVNEPIIVTVAAAHFYALRRACIPPGDHVISNGPPAASGIAIARCLADEAKVKVADEDLNAAGFAQQRRLHGPQGS